MRHIFAASLVLCLAGCPPPPYDYRHEPDPRRMEYVIGVLDEVKVVVWKNPELSTDAAVRPDGAITLPLIGDVHAAGRTPSQLRQEIVERLSAFVRDEGATVTVSIIAVNSYRFTVTGNVEHPGILNSRAFVTVSDALALAGGLNKFAARWIYLVRTDAEGKSRRIPVDTDSLSRGSQLEQNLVLMAGDVLFVP
jgi:polysaccharide export outer membrane protein